MALVKGTPAPKMTQLLSKSLRNWDVPGTNDPVVLQPDLHLLARIRAESPFVPKADTQAEVIQTKDGVHINLNLTVAEQRRIVEAEVKQPCVRLWLTAGEHTAAWAHKPDFTHGQLKDGRFFCWRKRADLEELGGSESRADVALYQALMQRVLSDDIR